MNKILKIVIPMVILLLFVTLVYAASYTKLGDVDITGNLEVDGNLTMNGFINHTIADGTIRYFDNGCYEKVNATGIYTIC